MEQSVANLVDMRDVSFTRGNRCIFDNISLTVPRGKITASWGHRASVKRRYSV